MITVQELRAWLAGEPEDSLVFIDDGSLALGLVDKDQLEADHYLQVGGLPDEAICTACGRTEADPERGEWGMTEDGDDLCPDCAAKAEKEVE